MSERGATIVETLTAMVVAGIITTGLISVFVPANRLSTQVSTAGEMQENARSALALVSNELRHVSRGGVLFASADSLVVRYPVALGALCANDGSYVTAYLPATGDSIPVGQVEGYAFADTLGDWAYTSMSGSSFLPYATNGNSSCTALGGGQAGTGSQYYRWAVSASQGPGTPFMVWSRRSFRFAPSLLDPSSRALRVGGPGRMIEIARGFSSTTRFEYRQNGQTTWTSTPSSGWLNSLDAVRVVATMTAEGSDGEALDVTREAHFLNAN
mgnify:CR=1 FL=1